MNVPTQAFRKRVSILENKHIDVLYRLLEESNGEYAAALRWAIFTIEQVYDMQAD